VSGSLSGSLFGVAPRAARGSPRCGGCWWPTWYLHYGFASMTAHVTALYPGSWPRLSRPGRRRCWRVRLAIIQLDASLTHYGTGRLRCSSARVVSQGTWWRVGFLVSLLDLLIWLGGGMLGGSCSAGGEAGPVTEPQGRSQLAGGGGAVRHPGDREETPCRRGSAPRPPRSRRPDEDRPPTRRRCSRCLRLIGPAAARDRHLTGYSALAVAAVLPPTGGSSPAT